MNRCCFDDDDDAAAVEGDKNVVRFFLAPPKWFDLVARDRRGIMVDGRFKFMMLMIASFSWN